MAHVAKHTIASRRVLEKCGFMIAGEQKELSGAAGAPVEEFVLKLDAGGRTGNLLKEERDE
jgi:RimJ/RimL family protein N-acetyltransferase